MQFKNLNFDILCMATIFIGCTSEKLDYPKADRGSICQELHGKKILDPYRWLEENDSNKTQTFIEDENKLTQSFLEKSGVRNKVREKLLDLWIQTRFIVGERYGKYYFSFKNRILYKQIDVTKVPVDVVLDRDKLSADGSIELDLYAISEDGSLIGYCTSKDGSKWNTIRIRNVETLKDYEDELHYVRSSSISWRHDNSGFFYSRYSKEVFENNNLQNHTVYFHRVNTPQSEDVPIFTHPNPLWRVGTRVSNDDTYLLLTFQQDSMHTAHSIANLKEFGEIKLGKKLKFKTIVSKFDAKYEYVANTESKFFFKTNKNAPRGRLVEFDFNTFIESKSKFSDYIAEDPTRYLAQAHAYGKEKLVLYYSVNPNVFEIHSLSDGKLICEVPMYKTITVGLNVAYRHSEIFFSVRSSLPPETVYYYKYDKDKPKEPTVLHENKWKGFDETKYTALYGVYAIRDNIQQGLYLIKKIHSKGPKPCLIIGYGGFGKANQPRFTREVSYFLKEFDGIVVWPTIRGEGILHEKGRKLYKKAAFEDFMEAAKFLVRFGYTEHRKIIITGVSHGGLLVASCINQAPELFGGAIPVVGLMDIIRFPEFGIGYAFVEELGNPANKTEFENILQYSPLHTIKDPTNSTNQYPATLVITGDNDDQVLPFHSLKYVAELQHKLKNNKFQTNPILLRVYKGVGHNLGQTIEESTDKLTFMHRIIYGEN